MEIFEAIFLGIVQGATEFLPVSSSGHLVLLPRIFGIGEASLTEAIIAHVGTLLAVLYYFWKDVVGIVNSVLRGLMKGDPLGETESRLGWFIVLGSIPAGAAGLLFEDSFETIFADPRWVAFFLLVTAVFLVMGERMLSGHKSFKEMSWLDAIIIGLFQMFALFPGVSRSGSTIAGALLRGLSRETAARYSFLMSIPVIAGAGLLGVVDLFSIPDLASQIPSMLIVLITSALVGYVCIVFLMQWIKERSFYPFAIYVASFGILYLAYSFVA
ncbi:MAG: undecaprenyl-diphosphatase UppP [Candidatus Promineifilaceae bacterium]